MRGSAIIALVGVLGWLHAPAPAAADTPVEIGLAELLVLVHERSPRVRAGRAEVDVVAAERVQARLRPNPVFGYGWARTLRGEDTLGGNEHTVTVAVPIRLGGKRAASIATADRALEAAGAELDAGLAELVRDAAHLHAELLAAQQRVSLLEEAVTEAERLHQVVAGRAREGAASRYHADRIELEITELRARLDEHRIERDETAGALATLVGLPTWRPRATGELAPLGVARAGPEALNERHPALRAASARERLADAAVVEARTQRWPDLELHAGGFATTDPQGLAGIVGIAVPLPLFDRGQGSMARAAAERRAAGQQREALAAEASAELARAVRRLEGRHQALRAFETGAVARLPGLRAMAEQAYLQGQSGIAELLDTLSAIIEVRLTHIDLARALLAAELDYLHASGRLDELRTTR